MNFTQRHIESFVKHIPADASENISVLGGRCGTAEVSEEKLTELFGIFEPVSCDKVTKRWVFTTPRGPVEVRDYWWNAHGEWSIAAANHKAANWVIRLLKTKGIEAYQGTAKRWVA